jgi:rubrerythrin
MRTLMTSHQWQEHFQANEANQLPIPWEEGAQLSTAETRAVIQSLQAWQLGETSDGAHLSAAARRYAFAQADPDFLDVVYRFIEEEQRHGELLGRFLDLHGAGRIRRNWGDTIFRRLRSCLLSMEIWTTVVIAVETLALVYYRAVMQATQSRVLQSICRQILKDEAHHLQFQYERLARMYAGRSAFALWLTLCFQRILFFGTTLAVWVGHHRALSAGGYPLRRFWRTAWKRMAFHWKLMHPTVWRQACGNSDAHSTTRMSCSLSSHKP